MSENDNSPSPVGEKPIEEKPGPPRRKHVQERFMLILIGVFIMGVVLYTVTPAGTIRVAVMAGYTVAMVWLIFKYAL